MPLALIIDDESDIRDLIEMGLMGQGIKCVLSPGIKDAIRQLKNHEFDFCVSDIKLPDGDGIEFLKYVLKNYPKLPVCMITAHGNMEMAITALKLGAFDFINKPFDLKQLRDMSKAALALAAVNEEEKTGAVAGRGNRGENSARLIGDSEKMQAVKTMISKVSRSQAPVFIHGASGTGKEVAAMMIHMGSVRKQGPFIPINCGAIPENLVESEFFGYKKGSFTGANQDHPGLFVSANGGTLFLDEVADLPLPMQVKLLRAIQERAVRAIGQDREVAVDVRIISATHKNLSQLVQKGEFREDLYYRLNVIQIHMPSLSERPEDIPILADYLLKRLCNKSNYKIPEITPEAMDKLSSYSFPGNVRELENALERAITFCDNHVITPDDIQIGDQALSGKTAVRSNDAAKADTKENNEDYILPNDLEAYLEEVERKAILNALLVTDNNKTKAAELLGISFRALRYKLKKLGID